MAAASVPQTAIITPEMNSDVFSMTDDGLARRFQFEREHGLGNWGSVWLALDKRTPEMIGEEKKKVAIKVVHRSKTQTTAARVRALWNEMKTVRSLRENGRECHPSIIAFDCFIITPSYALIVMEFLPMLLPVPVDEKTARPWMASLASAVEFMHSRGVVHNDIKPANIILSAGNTPTLVDFGFSERYPQNPKDAPVSESQDTKPAPFLSSLAYGTPEYLAPERAAGNTHDTRKADVWSLGVTFFEFLMARTPFEPERPAPDALTTIATFANIPLSPTKANKKKDDHAPASPDMDAYWARTVKGKWLNTGGGKLRGKMSVGLEALLRRMISPNADVRYTSEQVLRDAYWPNASSAPAASVKVDSSSRLKRAKSDIPTVRVDPGTPQQQGGALSSMVRTVLGNKSNLMGARSVSPATVGRRTEHKPSVLAVPAASMGVKADGKENGLPRSRSPRPAIASGMPEVSASTPTAPVIVPMASSAAPLATKSRKEKSAARNTKPAVVARPEEPPQTEAHDEASDGMLAVAQEAMRVKEIAADTRVDRMAIWVQNVERVVEDVKKTIARSDSQLSLLPPLPRAPSPLPCATSTSHSKPSTTSHPSPSPSSSTATATARPRANDIFAAPASANRTTSARHLQRQCRPIAIGNSVDLNAPAQVLRHAVSADYPFNARAIDGNATNGVKDVPAGPANPTVRKIKSDLVSGNGHGYVRTQSHNTMYLGRPRPVPVPVIPEVRVEDVDDRERKGHLVFIANASSTPPVDTERFYDRLIVSTNAVERIGKGYQSNICTQNDHKLHLTPNTHERPTAATPATTSVKRKLSASNFFLSVRDRPCEVEEAFIRAQGAAVAPIPPARPRRKIRQAASFDGFRNFARLDKAHSQGLAAPARPLSESIPHPPPCDQVAVTKVEKEKRRSTVTKTMRKAFLAIIGGGGVEKAN